MLTDQVYLFVIPAKAGTQLLFFATLGSRLRGNDEGDVDYPQLSEYLTEQP